MAMIHCSSPLFDFLLQETMVVFQKSFVFGNMWAPIGIAIREHPRTSTDLKLDEVHRKLPFTDLTMQRSVCAYISVNRTTGAQCISPFYYL